MRFSSRRDEGWPRLATYPSAKLQRVDERQVRDEWEAALEDAELTTEECVLLFTEQIPSDEGRGAQWWEPGMTIQADDHLVTEALAAEANSPENLSRHRVMVRRPLASDSLAVARLSAKIRHELEHARQMDACGAAVFQLSEVADWVLGRKIAGLPYGRVFTNLKPVEQDANAASAIFLRTRWPKAVDPLLHDRDDAPLVRSLTPPGSVETLITRMVAFLFLYEDLCEDLARGWAISFGEHLDDIAQGTDALWATLQAASGGPPPAAGAESRNA
jgi:hypothetical protein